MFSAVKYKGHFMIGVKINQPANKHLRNLNIQFQGFIKQLNQVSLRLSVNIRKNQYCFDIL